MIWLVGYGILAVCSLAVVDKVLTKANERKEQEPQRYYNYFEENMRIAKELGWC